jgi:hypothetical protein
VIWVLLTVWLMGAASFSTCPSLGRWARVLLALLWPYWLARAVLALCRRAVRASLRRGAL